MVGNIQTALVHAKEIGIRVINVGADDFMFPRAHLVLGILWQLVRLDLILKVGQLAKYLSEDIRGSESSNGEEILLRWVNFHLKEAKHPRVCTNFGADIKDSEIYVVLLTQLAPKECSRSILEETDLTKRAELFLQAADRVNCRQFIKPSDIVGGIDRLNLAFVANLFTEFNKKKISVEEDLPEDDIVIPEDSNLTDVQEEIRKLKQELMEHDAKAFEQEKSLERQEEDLLEKALKLQNDLEKEKRKNKRIERFQKY